jgi:hypothetical protein
MQPMPDRRLLADTPPVVPDHRRDVPILTLTLLTIAAASLAGTNDGPLLFTDVTTAAGIGFVETIGDDDMTNIVESTGVGCGFLDYDGDGWLDIYLVNGCWLEGVSDPKLDAKRRQTLAAATGRLYRNCRDGTFEDVTTRAGLARPGYGMGVVVADYDGDGDPDIYITNYGPNFLFRNNGDGTFAEVARNAGVDAPAFSVGAVFFDYDHDGRLDLYVGNYITYDPTVTPEHAQDVVRSPLLYAGQPDRLFRGNADGTFTDVTRTAGLEVQPPGRAMGVAAFDYDGDGWLDVFVANDAMENHLWHNQGDGTFQNRALLAGVAFGESGAAAASMAVEVGDYDNDGLLDVLVPDMTQCCLYRNLGRGLFEDVAVRAGLAAVMNRYHSWGGVLADFDLDGALDIYIATGNACRLQGQENCVFVGDGHGRFTDVSASAGPALAQKFVSRGVARGDFDNDGDVDLLINNLNDRPVLLRNDTPRGERHWLGIELVGRPPNRDAIGALVKVTVGGRTMVRPRVSGGSYLCQHDPRLHFGIGPHRQVDRVDITWPDGTRQMLGNVPADQYLVVRQETPPPGANEQPLRSPSGGENRRGMD